MLNTENRKRWLGYVCAMLALAGILYFLWHDDFVNDWVVALGAAYLYLDRYTENEEGE